MEAFKTYSITDKLELYRSLIHKADEATLEPKSHSTAALIDVYSEKLSCAIGKLETNQVIKIFNGRRMTQSALIHQADKYSAHLIELISEEKKPQTIQPMDELLYIEDAFDDVSSAAQQIRNNPENIVDEDELSMLEETLEDLESQIDAAKKQLSWEKRQRLNEKINREDI